MSIGVLMKLVQKEERETNVTKDTIYQESEENGSNKNIWQGRSLRHNCRGTNIGLGTKISRHELLSFCKFLPAKSWKIQITIISNSLHISFL